MRANYCSDTPAGERLGETSNSAPHFLGALLNGLSGFQEKSRRPLESLRCFSRGQVDGARLFRRRRHLSRWIEVEESRTRFDETLNGSLVNFLRRLFAGFDNLSCSRARLFYRGSDAGLGLGGEHASKLASAIGGFAHFRYVKILNASGHRREEVAGFRIEGAHRLDIILSDTADENADVDARQLRGGVELFGQAPCFNDGAFKIVRGFFWT